MRDYAEVLESYIIEDEAFEGVLGAVVGGTLIAPYVLSLGVLIGYSIKTKLNKRSDRILGKKGGGISDFKYLAIPNILRNVRECSYPKDLPSIFTYYSSNALKYENELIKYHSKLIIAINKNNEKEINAINNKIDIIEKDVNKLSKEIETKLNFMNKSNISTDIGFIKIILDFFNKYYAHDFTESLTNNSNPRLNKIESIDHNLRNNIFNMVIKPIKVKLIKNPKIQYSTVAEEGFFQNRKIKKELKRNKKKDENNQEVIKLIQSKGVEIESLSDPKAIEFIEKIRAEAVADFKRLCTNINNVSEIKKIKNMCSKKYGINIDKLKISSYYYKDKYSHIYDFIFENKDFIMKEDEAIDILYSCAEYVEKEFNKKYEEYMINKYILSKLNIDGDEGVVYIELEV